MTYKFQLFMWRMFGKTMWRANKFTWKTVFKFWLNNF